MLELLTLGDYFGTLVFAVTGGLAAAEKKLDLGGFVLLAFVTGVGGGTLRDLILNRGLVFWAEEPAYIVLCVSGAVLVFFVAHRLPRLHKALVWSDAVGLAVFAVIGSAIALESGARPLVAILMGVLTATGGGVIREMIRNEIPLMLHREIYMSAALAGSGVLVGLDSLGAPTWVAIWVGAGVAFALRGAGIVFDLHPPTYSSARRSSASAPDDG